MDDRIYYLNDILPFGKYRGKTIHQIWSMDPGYIKWATGNNVFKVEGSFRPEVKKEEELPYWHSCPWMEPRECPF